MLLQRQPGAAKQLRDARAAASGGDPAPAVEAARAAIEEGRATGDPRYFGQAQALLQPWWNRQQPPPAVQLLRATLLQQRHDFKAAVLDLDALLAADPANAQARLTRATVKLVLGEPLAAKRDCAALIGRAGFVAVATCLGAADAAMGRAEAALATLEQAIAREPGTDVETLRWAETQAASIAEQLGDAAKAEAHYAAALKLAAGQNDVYLKAAYADHLLRQGKAAQVREQLQGLAAFDALLLRLALAEHLLAAEGDAPAATAEHQHVNDLKERYALAEIRGDAAHTREMARLAVELEGDGPKALSLANRNWTVQRETADALVLLQAALLAEEPAAAEPALDWLKHTGLQDVRLTPLLQKLGAAR